MIAGLESQPYAKPRNAKQEWLPSYIETLFKQSLPQSLKH